MVRWSAVLWRRAGQLYLTSQSRIVSTTNRLTALLALWLPTALITRCTFGGCRPGLSMSACVDGGAAAGASPKDGAVLMSWKARCGRAA